jgi:phospholipase C
VKRFFIAQIALIFALTGCGQEPTKLFPASPASYAGARLVDHVDHVVIIIQENRTVDNLFNGLPGADTVQSGKDSTGHDVLLKPISLSAPYDISHRHPAWKVEYDHGRLDGFNLVHSHCDFPTKCPVGIRRAYGYVPLGEVKPYFAMAEQYGFADRMFESNQGPSFPAHQYLLSGTSEIAPGSPLLAAENPLTPDDKWTGGCDSPPGSLVYLINQKGQENKQIYPCFDHIALTNLLEKKSLSWRYYGDHRRACLWNAPDALKQIRNSPEFLTDDVTPPWAILTDIKGGRLANVSWVTPTALESDHAGNTNGSGPSWVASVVNAVGESPFWNDTVVFVVWDDWGGWYDHVSPPLYNSYELGFRVPLIVISRYAKKGFISHRTHEFGSILKYIEKNFDLGSLKTTDVRSDDLSDFFNYDRTPRRFVPIKAPHKESYFLHQPPSTLDADPDDDR